MRRTEKLCTVRHRCEGCSEPLQRLVRGRVKGDVRVSAEGRWRVAAQHMLHGSDGHVRSVHTQVHAAVSVTMTSPGS